MRHPASQALFAHWSDLRRGATPPDRDDLDPASIGAILQDVFILGRENADSWRFRVAGTRLALLAGRELRDERFDLWWSIADRTDALRMLEGVGQDNVPLVGGVRGHDAAGAAHELELLLLPLRHLGRGGARILGAFFPTAAVARRHDLRIERLTLTSVRALDVADQRGRIFGAAQVETPLERRRAFRVIEGDMRA